MKYVIIYWSTYGNGKKLVDYIAKKLSEKGGETKVLTTKEADPKLLPIADLYVFSAPAEAFNLQRNMKRFMKEITGMDGKKYGIINTHGMKKNRLYKMEKLLSNKNMLKIAEVEFKVEGDIQSGNGLPKGWEKKLDEFVKKL